MRQPSGLGKKRNGFQFGSGYAGRFDMKPSGSVRIFGDVSRTLYIRVQSQSGIVFLKPADTGRTRVVIDSPVARRGTE